MVRVLKVEMARTANGLEEWCEEKKRSKGASWFGASILCVKVKSLTKMEHTWDRCFPDGF